MKDFVETIKNLPDIIKKTARVYKNSWNNSGWYFLGYIFFSIVVAFSPYIRNWAQGNILNVFQSGVDYIGQIYTDVVIFIIAILLPSIVAVFSQFVSKMSYYKDGEFYENKVIEKSLNINPQLHEDKYFTNLLNKTNEKGVYVLNNFKLDSFNIILDF